MSSLEGLGSLELGLDLFLMLGSASGPRPKGDFGLVGSGPKGSDLDGLRTCGLSA
jgi:hypothetical protein